MSSKYTVIGYAPDTEQTYVQHTMAATAKDAAEKFFIGQRVYDEWSAVYAGNLSDNPPANSVDTAFHFVCAVPGHVEVPYAAEDV